MFYTNLNSVLIIIIIIIIIQYHTRPVMLHIGLIDGFYCRFFFIIKFARPIFFSFYQLRPLCSINYIAVFLILLGKSGNCAQFFSVLDWLLCIMKILWIVASTSVKGRNLFFVVRLCIPSTFMVTDHHSYKPIICMQVF